MVPSPCTRYNNYIFNWAEKGDSAHSLHLSYIPVSYIPRILNRVQTRTKPRTAPATEEEEEEERGREGESADLCGDHRASVVHRSRGEKKKSRGLER